MARIRNRKTAAERAWCRAYYNTHKEYFSVKQKIYKLHPGWKIKKRGYALWANFRIKLEAWQRLFISQNCTCAICKTTYPGKKGWATDHNPTSEKGNPNYVRGILCNNCNTGLGQFKENPDLLREAINYLVWHGQS